MFGICNLWARGKRRGFGPWSSALLHFQSARVYTDSCTPFFSCFCLRFFFFSLVSFLILSAGTIPDVDFFWCVSHPRWMSSWGRNGDHPGPLLSHRTPSPPHCTLNLTRWPLQPYPIRPPSFPPTHRSSYFEVIRHQRGHGQERNQNAHVRLRHSQTLSAWQARCKSSTSATAHRFRVPNNANLSVCALSLCAPQMPSCSIFTAPQTTMKIDK